MGSHWSALSKMTLALAMLERGRSADPLKIMSSVLRPRSSEKDCSPSTQRRLSAILLLPDPLGPMMQVILPNSNSVRPAKVLYPCNSKRNKRRGMAYASGSQQLLQCGQVGGGADCIARCGAVNAFEQPA